LFAFLWCVPTIFVLAGSDRLLISPKFSRPDVTIQHYSHLNYWMVTIRCKDRNKLFFDTVCTLSDLNYDVYHGAIDSEGHLAVQLYYIRPRFGDFFWDSVKATKLRVMLEAAIQRRFPKGLKVRRPVAAEGVACSCGSSSVAIGSVLLLCVLETVDGIRRLLATLQCLIAAVLCHKHMSWFVRQQTCCRCVHHKLAWLL